MEGVQWILLYMRYPLTDNSLEKCLKQLGGLMDQSVSVYFLFLKLFGGNCFAPAIDPCRMSANVVGVPGGAVKTRTVKVGSTQIQMYMS